MKCEDECTPRRCGHANGRCACLKIGRRTAAHHKSECDHWRNREDRHDRQALDAHSPSESITGCIVGAVAALAFIAGSWRAVPHRWSVPAVVASLALVTVALHGITVPSHRWVTKVALQLSGHERPFVRARWKANPNYRPASQPSSLQRTRSSPQTLRT